MIRLLSRSCFGAHAPRVGFGSLCRLSLGFVAPALLVSGLGCSSESTAGGSAGMSATGASGGNTASMGGRTGSGGANPSSGTGGVSGSISSGGSAVSNGGSSSNSAGSGGALGGSGPAVGGSGAAGSANGGASGSGGSETVDARGVVKALGFGTNIGNTLENTTTWETGWGQPLITQNFINGMASHGIRT